MIGANEPGQQTDKKLYALTQAKVCPKIKLTDITAAMA
jgi:hypothetical protein